MMPLGTASGITTSTSATHLGFLPLCCKEISQIMTGRICEPSSVLFARGPALSFGVRRVLMTAVLKRIVTITHPLLVTEGLL